jgi:hypothetical protein
MVKPRRPDTTLALYQYLVTDSRVGGEPFPEHALGPTTAVDVGVVELVKTHLPCTIKCGEPSLPGGLVDRVFIPGTADLHASVHHV